MASHGTVFLAEHCPAWDMGGGRAVGGDRAVPKGVRGDVRGTMDGWIPEKWSHGGVSGPFPVQGVSKAGPGVAVLL